MKKVSLFMVGVFSVTNAFAATYTVTQVTDDTVSNQYERLNQRGDVVWATWVNAADPGWTIFEYNAKTKETTQVSSNNAFFDTHQVNNKGDVVWTASDGNDQEVYLYNAETQTVMPLTDNDNDDTDPQISDNGDVSWLEQQGTSLANAILMRYDSASKTSSAVTFPNATRQGYQTMNAKGDIVWNAVLADNQQVLLYNAATGAMTNLSNNENAINSNQRIMDNGDVVWETYDLTTYQQSVMYYKASDGSVSQVVNNVGGHLFGTHGNVVWVSYLNGTYTITTYDPATGAVADVATETGTARPPGVTAISARGDVTWRVISGTDWISRVYNAQTGEIVDLTDTQGFGTYDLDLADNGDVVWSLWDGTDYEVYTYQADSGVITQLSDNQVNDGITTVNGSGTILWNRFDPSDNELMLAVRDPKPLKMHLKDVDLEQQEAEAEIKSGFQYEGLPNINEHIAVSVNGVSLINTLFSDFVSKGKGIYRYKTADTKVLLNFNAGILHVEKDNTDVTAMKAQNTANVTINFGPSTAEDTYALDE